MRWIVFSDLHIHAHPDFDIQVGHSSSRLLDCLKVLDKVKEYYDREKCDGVIFTGDMFHTPRAVETSIYEPAFKRLEQLTESVNIFVGIAGNHDKSETSKGGPSHSSVYPVGRLSNSHIVVKETESIRLKQTTIHCLPYTKDAEEYTECVKRLKGRVKRDRHNIILTHCSLKEAVNGPNEIRLKDAWSIKDLRNTADYIFCGHHHHPQRLNSRCLVVGSPIQHNMLDRGDRRGLVVYDDSTGEVKRIWLKFSSFFLYEITDPSQLPDISGFWTDKENGYVRIIFRYIPQKDVLNRLNDALDKAKVRGREIKIQRAPLNAVRNEKLTLQLTKSNDFKSSISTYVDHVKDTMLNRERLVRIGESLIDKSKEGT